MQTFRVKLNTVCDEEVLAKNKEEAIEIAKTVGKQNVHC